LEEARTVAEALLLRNGFSMDELVYKSRGISFMKHGEDSRTISISPSYILRLKDNRTVSGGRININVCSDGRITEIDNSLPHNEKDGPMVELYTAQEAFMSIKPDLGCGDTKFIITNISLQYYFVRSGENAWELRPAWDFEYCGNCGGTTPAPCLPTSHSDVFIDANTLKTVGF
jgi:hypothetical protein